MRILLSCLQDLRRHEIPAYRFWATYFRNGIIESGHDFTEVPNVDWAEGATRLEKNALRQWLERTWTQTLRFIDGDLRRGMKIDLFLSYFYPQQIDSAAIAQIRSRGIPCVNFFCDNIREFTRMPREYESFDLHWVPEWEALEMYARAGTRTCFAPMPCWVPPEARAQVMNENGQVTFIGSSDELRRDLFSRALSLGAPIRIAGAGWLQSGSTGSSSRSGKSVVEIAHNQAEFIRSRGVRQWIRKTARRVAPVSNARVPGESLLPPIDDTNYIKLTKESTVTLGVNRVPTFQRSRSRPLTYSRLRDIEAPMMGACYLTEWTEGLEQFYEIGREIETYRTAEEMVSKIDRLKSDRERRMLLRRNGQRKALSELTVGKSLAKVISALEH